MSRDKTTITSWDIKIALAALSDLAAKGNIEAAKELHGIAESTVDELDELCHHSPELFESIAHKTSFWPGWLSCDADIKERGGALVKTLKLGSEMELNYASKRWTRKAPGTFVALQLWGMLEIQRKQWRNRHEFKKWLLESRKRINKRLGRPADYRPKLIRANIPEKLAKEFALYRQSFELVKNLEPLNRNNYGQWFKAAKPTFIARYGDNFEDHKQFAKKRLKAEVLCVAECKKTRGIARREILKSIQQGFESIAPKFSKME